jgi:hypothetical protein
MTDFARAIELHDEMLADAGGDLATAYMALAVQYTNLEARYRLAVSPGYVRANLPRSAVEPKPEPEAL